MSSIIIGGGPGAGLKIIRKCAVLCDVLCRPFFRTILRCCDLTSIGKSTPRRGQVELPGRCMCHLPKWSPREIKLLRFGLGCQVLSLESTMPKRTWEHQVKKVKALRWFPRALSKFLENDMVAASSEKKEQYVVDKPGWLWSYLTSLESRKPWFLKRIPKTILACGLSSSERSLTTSQLRFQGSYQKMILSHCKNFKR